MVDEPGPTIEAKLSDGPLAGSTIEVATVEGRPPKTIDIDGTQGARSRYCLTEWTQAGKSAAYSFLYQI